ncbi:hypothetical protein BD289DRAFT_443532 [Coniella lustricola]|uniref:Uncharacterized protein n=1 Tax=Coniella lustricola TaxID=2025994 RepID=A0A2T2ZWX7_9PEZI|nr:hypothetical protein BD289DRAFT_443532 [Coniella lustricola]
MAISSICQTQRSGTFGKPAQPKLCRTKTASARPAVRTWINAADQFSCDDPPSSTLHAATKGHVSLIGNLRSKVCAAISSVTAIFMEFI